MESTRNLFTIATLWLILVLALQAFAKEPVSEPQSIPAPAMAVANNERPANKLALRIAEIIAVEQEEVGALSARIEDSRDPEEVRVLQQRVQVVKLTTEKRILQVQLEELRPGADPDQIKLWEESIASLSDLVARTKSRLPEANDASGHQR